MLQNAIVLMMDSLQFNYLGCYGGNWCKTPNMDRLAREGVLFENAYSEGLPTVPVRRAMHTGRFTLPVAGWVPLSMEDTTIADLCWGRPIDTALVFDCPMYRLPKFGYTRGFDKVWFLHGHCADYHFYSEDPLLHYKFEDFYDPAVIKETIRRGGGTTAHLDSMRHEIECYLRMRQTGLGTTPETRYISVLMKEAVRYLEQVDRNKQFYLWIDSFDPHEPWDPPSVYSEDKKCPYDPDYTGCQSFYAGCDVVPKDGSLDRHIEHVRMLFAELITICDTALGHLMDAMRRLGFEQNTLLLITADHGEPFGNGEHGHGITGKCRPWPYEELVHIPLIIRAPGLPAGRRVKGFVQSVDVAPTICDWLGIGVHPDMQGKSLLPLCRGEAESVRDWAIAGYYGYSWSLITDEWSYIHWLQPGQDPMQALFDMYAKTLNETSAYLNQLEGSKGAALAEVLNDMAEDKKNKPEYDAKASLSETEAAYKASITTDGADQWTCTPGSTVEIPETDELYKRKTDPFQLHNVIEQYPDEARAMLRRLKEIMAELRAS